MTRTVRRHSDIAIVAGDLRRAGELAERNARVIADDSGALAVLEQAGLAARTLLLELTYLARLDRLAGDLPALDQQLSSLPRPTGSYQDNAGTLVYVAYDNAGGVLYIGVTDDLFGRMAAHRRGSAWWRNMARIDWEEWPDRATALRKEALLIRRHRPRFNIAENPDARSAR